MYRYLQNLKNAVSVVSWPHRALCMILILAVLTGCGTAIETGISGNSLSSESISSTGSTTSAANAKDSDTSSDVLKVEILKVGKADAMILTCGGSTMIIDCGEEEDGLEVLNYLQGEGINKVDVLIVTHFDKDHVGGADMVVEGIKVNRVILPAYTGTGTEYMDFMTALSNAGITPENITENVAFNLGSASVLIEPPSSYEMPEKETEYDNNFSLITTVLSHGKRLVFTGDIEKQRIREWLEIGTARESDVLKVPHHGTYNSALDDLFKTLKPQYAIICDSKKNMADERTIELLKGYGSDCLETCYGDITIICSEAGIEIQQD